MLRRRYDPCRIPLLGRIYKRYICLEFYYRGAVMGVGDVGDSCILSTRGVATGERGVILGLVRHDPRPDALPAPRSMPLVPSDRGQKRLACAPNQARPRAITTHAAANAATTDPLRADRADRPSAAPTTRPKPPPAAAPKMPEKT